MKMAPHKKLAHPSPVERFNEPIVVFLTACSHDRSAHFNNESAHAALLSAWERAVQWHVAEYVMMPDHIHLFCVPGVSQPESVKDWSSYWKRLAGQVDPSLRAVWQADVWDRQIRTREQLDEKRSYVRMNPVRAGLCVTPEGWGYRGILRDIRW